MKQTRKLALLNNDNQVVRTLEVSASEVLVVYSRSGRLMFFDKSQELDLEQYEVSQTFKVESINEKGLEIKGIGRIVHFNNKLNIKSDIEAMPEEEDRLPFYLKWTALSEVAIVLLLFISSWTIQHFFQEEAEVKPVLVTIQKRAIEKVKTVAVSEKKIVRKKYSHVKKVSHKYVKPTKSKVYSKRPSKKVKVVSQKAKLKNVNQVGSLGVIAGFSKKSGKLGQSRFEAKSGRNVYGQGAHSSKGGLARSLTGKGLVASGNSKDSAVKGYSGLGTKGVAGGQQGYGRERIDGSAGEYFTPLVDESLVVGGLDKEQIHAVVQKNMGQIVYCYEKGLQTKPNLRGRVSVKFVINSMGSIQSAGIQGTSLSAKKVESCIIAKLKNWKFPKPVGGVQVRVKYPFILNKLSQG